MKNKLDKKTLYNAFWNYLSMIEKTGGKTIHLEKEIDDAFAIFIEQTSKVADFSEEDTDLVRGEIKSNISIVLNNLLIFIIKLLVIS